jgi:hypothetical protein
MKGTLSAPAIIDRRVNPSIRREVAQLERRRAELLDELGRKKAADGARLFADLVLIDTQIEALVSAARGQERIA